MAFGPTYHIRDPQKLIKEAFAPAMTAIFLLPVSSIASAYQRLRSRRVGRSYYTDFVRGVVATIFIPCVHSVSMRRGGNGDLEK